MGRGEAVDHGEEALSVSRYPVVAGTLRPAPGIPRAARGRPGVGNPGSLPELNMGRASQGRGEEGGGHGSVTLPGTRAACA